MFRVDVTNTFFHSLSLGSSIQFRISLFLSHLSA